jgi:hypothetical protein
LAPWPSPISYDYDYWFMTCGIQPFDAIVLSEEIAERRLGRAHVRTVMELLAPDV